MHVIKLKVFKREEHESKEEDIGQILNNHDLNAFVTLSVTVSSPKVGRNAFNYYYLYKLIRHDITFQKSISTQKHELLTTDCTQRNTYDKVLFSVPL